MNFLLSLTLSQMTKKCPGSENLKCTLSHQCIPWFIFFAPSLSSKAFSFELPAVETDTVSVQITSRLRQLLDQILLMDLWYDQQWSSMTDYILTQHLKSSPHPPLPSWGDKRPSVCSPEPNEALLAFRKQSKEKQQGLFPCGLFVLLRFVLGHSLTNTDALRRAGMRN